MKNRNERIEYIKKAQEAVDSRDQKTYQIPWRDQQKHFPIIRIDISYLMFWLDNSRTLRQQIEYKQSHTDQDNIFIDPETSIGQNAQREILDEMLNSTPLGKGIIKDLNDRGQQEPVIITHDGFIINGNRRVAAMMGLGIANVDCVVLPKDAIKKDYYDLEQELQLSQDFKESYHWVNELLNIEHGLTKLKIESATLAKRLRRDVKDISTAHRKKYLIDEFLEWRGLPNRYDYHKLDDAEQAFIELEKVTKSSSFPPSQRDKLKSLIFSLIENRPESGRLYAHIKDLISNYNDVTDSLKEKDVDSPHELTYVPTVPPSLPSNSQISEGEPTVIEQLVDTLGENEIVDSTTLEFDYQNAQENVSKLVEAIEDAKYKNKEKGDAEALYNGVYKAHRSLLTLTVDTNSTKLMETKFKLNEILKIVYNLIETIDENI